MSATTVSNIVASMEALMGQVKELQARASACEAAKAAAEALAHNRGAVMEVQAHVSAEYERRTWAAISSALSAEERNGLHTHEAVQKMAAELIKLRALAAAAAPPAVGSLAAQALPRAAVLEAGVAAVKAVAAAEEAKKVKRVPEHIKESLAHIMATESKARPVVFDYSKRAEQATALATLAELGLAATVDGSYVSVSKEEMARWREAYEK